jgi:hypothetical protein
MSYNLDFRLITVPLSNQSTRVNDLKLLASFADKSKIRTRSLTK